VNIPRFLRAGYVDGQLSAKNGRCCPIQINEGIEVRVEDNPIFLAEIGEVSGQVAVSLSRRI